MGRAIPTPILTPFGEAEEHVTLLEGEGPVSDEGLWWW